MLNQKSNKVLCTCLKCCQNDTEGVGLLIPKSTRTRHRKQEKIPVESNLTLSSATSSLIYVLVLKVNLLRLWIQMKILIFCILTLLKLILYLLIQVLICMFFKIIFLLKIEVLKFIKGQKKMNQMDHQVYWII